MRMIDEEALSILRDGGGGWVDWDDETGRPQWDANDGGNITLDGNFTADELRAILHFAPKEE
jgi:hypothetical protein